MWKGLIRIVLGATIALSAVPAHTQDPNQDQNLLPKYGSLPKSEALKRADATFVASMDQIYHGDLSKASADAAARGWQYMSQRNPEDAMRRFNQAWLLNHNNGIAIWGMAAVEGSFGHFDESLKLFSEADNLVVDNINFSVDYARSLGMAGAERKDDKLLKIAYNRFEHNYEKAPDNVLNLQNWAITLFAVGRYSEAWQKVKLAEATPSGGHLDPNFLAALQSHLPRPN